MTATQLSGTPPVTSDVRSRRSAAHASTADRAPGTRVGRILGASCSSRSRVALLVPFFWMVVAR